eukprot:Sspe_Gene.41650::Locus_20157_Transcript_1_1_Confidence_1.000_Length_1331::g.41650::m.41650
MLPSPLSSPKASLRGSMRRRRLSVRQASARINIIKQLGFPLEEELKLVAMVNDPTLIDLFTTLLPESDEEMGYFKMALSTALTYTAGSVGAAGVQRMQEIEDAVKAAKEEWRQMQADEMQQMEARITESISYEWQMKWDQRERRIQKWKARVEEETEAASRKREREACREVLQLEDDLLDMIHAIEIQCSNQIRKHITGLINLPIPNSAAVPRTAGPLDAPLPDGSDDPVERELELPKPNIAAHIHDCQKVVRHRMLALGHVQQTTYTRVVDVMSARAAELTDALSAANSTIAQHQKTIDTQAELIKELTKPRVDKEQQTNTTGSDLDDTLELLEDTRKALREEAEARKTAEGDVEALLQRMEAQAVATRGVEQDLSNLVARVQRLIPVVEEQIQRKIEDMVGLVPYLHNLPPAVLSDEETKPLSLQLRRPTHAYLRMGTGAK